MAQSKPAGVWKSGFSSEREGARWLAQQLRVPVGALLRSRRHSLARSSVGLEQPVSGWKGVVPRIRSQAILWEARAGQQVLGYYRTASEAAGCVAKALGVPRRELRKPGKLSRKAARDIFCAAYKVFQQYMPGDLQQTIDEDEKHAGVFRKELLEVILCCDIVLVFEDAIRVCFSYRGLGVEAFSHTACEFGLPPSICV